ncbi:uncharacterized protein [Euwallacea fornicatus]|uniref:uncharacterized protein n=1 Tax=Euwallacea fornicatus TaxID=995702 RepID=UPI00338FFEA9
MQVFKIILAISFAIIFVPLCGADIFFSDCGSEVIQVEAIHADRCNSTPCFFSRGQAYNLTVIPDYLDSIDSSDLIARVLIRGAEFEVTAKLNEACGLPCPIEERVFTPHIPVTIELGISLIRGPADLTLNSTYWSGGMRRSRFCVQVGIVIY